MGKKRKKSRAYFIPDNEVLAGIIDKPCTKCGVFQMLVRREVFKNQTEHLAHICGACGKHHFYLSQYEYPGLMSIPSPVLKPIGKIDPQSGFDI